MNFSKIVFNAEANSGSIFKSSSEISRQVPLEETNFIYDKQYVILETNQGGTEQFRYIRGLNYIAKINSFNELSYYLFNGHGDVVQTVSEDGELKNQYDYDVFGNPILTVEVEANAIRYAGEFYDEESGLYYLRARYYDPYTARFISRDSYWGEDANPLSLNLYTYAYNNPNMYVDPSGHIPLPLPKSKSPGKGSLGGPKKDWVKPKKDKKPDKKKPDKKKPSKSTTNRKDNSSKNKPNSSPIPMDILDFIPGNIGNIIKNNSKLQDVLLGSQEKQQEFTKQDLLFKRGMQYNGRKGWLGRKPIPSFDNFYEGNLVAFDADPTLDNYGNLLPEYEEYYEEQLDILEETIKAIDLINNFDKYLRDLIFEIQKGGFAGATIEHPDEALKGFLTEAWDSIYGTITGTAELLKDIKDDPIGTISDTSQEALNQVFDAGYYLFFNLDEDLRNLENNINKLSKEEKAAIAGTIVATILLSQSGKIKDLLLPKKKFETNQIDKDIEGHILDRVAELRGQLPSAYKRSGNFALAEVEIEGIDKTESSGYFFETQ
ncbi:RHS repeat domain-containing protein [Chengkuizengella axinellae]|uniref:RHS repeat-associated core domain-containing protein n=1 Tax=Chengkuizengella axinellae TaxID=3064388 RepID=A0ABT9J2R0_9BACL|nr:RHS repeat-associated core domain-containing protein [Chengkuizengella sp. 2205SS18-9]MDP5275904.1 RHS repeat-associated core domain-containing protein [Chengkuizengella sp. 2205SS18-9]